MVEWVSVVGPSRVGGGPSSISMGLDISKPGGGGILPNFGNAP